MGQLNEYHNENNYIKNTIKDIST